MAALVALGNTRRVSGRYDDAERLLREALAFGEEAPGETDIQIAAALNALAVTFKYSGRFDEGEPLLKRALRIPEQTLGPDPPRTLRPCRHDLGGLYHARRDFEAAEPFARRAVEARVKAVGTGDLPVAVDSAALAPILDELRRRDEAEALLRDALVVVEREYGADHNEVAVTLNNLAAIAQRRGEVA
jgi:tetratricopeptide (TPR) repeat protein